MFQQIIIDKKLCYFIILFIFIFFNYKFCYNKKDKITVIIPTYNRKKLVNKAIKSVLNQTYSNIEIIVIDDCSTDNSENEIKKIKDTRIRYIKLRKRKGANYARNRGILKASGEFISFLDSFRWYIFL